MYVYIYIGQDVLDKDQHTHINALHKELTIFTRTRGGVHYRGVVHAQSELSKSVLMVWISKNYSTGDIYFLKTEPLIVEVDGSNGAIYPGIY